MGAKNVSGAPNTQPSTGGWCFEDSYERDVTGARSTLTGGARAWVRILEQTLPSAAGMRVIEPKIGERLGGVDGLRFELLERLGGGGMSVVYLARDAMLDRLAAIKFLARDGLDTVKALDRIRREARACARMNHPNVVRLFDLGTDSGTPFLVMEYLEGRSLDAILRDERIDALRAVRILIDVSKGLLHAHGMGVVHRDLKPSNVFITKDGMAKILDFGVASFAAGPQEPNGMARARSGTPRYMSPEQWKGEAQDGRTDIWAVGIMLFELLTGRPPFHAESVGALGDIVASSEPHPLLRASRPDLPEKAEEIIRFALAKDPVARYVAACELVHALLALESLLAPAPRKNKRSNKPRSCGLDIG